MSRSIWGWGFKEHKVDDVGIISNVLPVPPEAAFPEFDEDKVAATLRPPRFSIEDNSIRSMISSDNRDRMMHTYGKSFKDIVRGLQGIYNNPPDYVAFPQNEGELCDLVRYANCNQISLIPYGGGTSVVGGVEVPTESHKVISVDMRHFDRLLEVDKECLTVRVQAGVKGPHLLNLLKPYGLTFRHFPQSFEFSTVGGWVATRAGGHYATGWTHIDDFVIAVKMITPTGVITTNRVPSSGAGPNENRFIIGSEGILGIITEVWLRVQEIIKYKSSVAVSFPSLESGVEAARKLSQSGLNPTNCRLVDPLESFTMGLSKNLRTTLILGFESSSISDLSSWMEPALRICRSCGGEYDEPQAKNVSDEPDYVEGWKRSFIKAPYLRDALVKRGYIIETFESACIWSKVLELNNAVIAAVKRAAPYPSKVIVTMRLTHIYPDGAAPYWTVIAVGNAGRQVEEWDCIKKAVSDVLLSEGATITHHHAVGRDHAPWYMHEKDTLLLRALMSGKRTLDPNMIMNPGVLFPHAEFRSMCKL